MKYKKFLYFLIVTFLSIYLTNPAFADSKTSFNIPWYGVNVTTVVSQENILENISSRFVPGNLVISTDANLSGFNPQGIQYPSTILTSPDGIQCKTYPVANPIRGIWVEGKIRDASKNVLGEYPKGNGINTIFDARPYDSIVIELYLMIKFEFACDYPGGSFSGSWPLNISIKRALVEIKKIDQELDFGALSQVELNAKFVRFQPLANSGLPIQSTELSPSICLYQNGVLMLKKVGICSLLFNQEGNEIYNQYSRTVDIEVRDSSKSSIKIICISRNLTKIITGPNPKCPLGYRQKK